MAAEEQAVVDTDEQATPVTEEGGAQGDDLDSLLNEWESRSKSETKEETPKPQQKSEQSEDPNEIKQVAAWVREQQQRQIEEQTEKDIRKSVERIKSEMDNPVSDVFIEGVLWRQASKDQRFLNAWQNRHKDPDGFDRILGAVRKNIEKELGSQPDKRLSADREAVTSAVRGASNAPPVQEGPTKEGLAKMNDREFQDYLRTLR